MYVIATVICPNFHFSVSPHVPFLNLLFEQIAIPTSIYLQNFVSIQPRTNPVKFAAPRGSLYARYRCSATATARGTMCGGGDPAGPRDAPRGDGRPAGSDALWYEPRSSGSFRFFALTVFCGRGAAVTG